MVKYVIIIIKEGGEIISNLYYKRHCIISENLEELQRSNKKFKILICDIDNYDLSQIANQNIYVVRGQWEANALRTSLLSFDIDL